MAKAVSGSSRAAKNQGSAKSGKQQASATKSARSPSGEFRLIGGRLRYLRHLKQYTLAELAQRAECSESLVSRIENDLVVPSLSTLHRLSQALGTSVVELLASDEAPSCVVYRASERPILGPTNAIDGDGSVAESLIPHSEKRALEGLLIILPAGGTMCGPFRHAGEEVGFVIEGSLELVVNEQRYKLHTGDSFFFQSDLPHSYRALGSSRCRVVWVNTPPTF